ncbi:MAG: cyclohexadienyl dehydrogenase, partial [Methylocystaceae bacterium]
MAEADVAGRAPIFDKVALIGSGLIGSSIARAIRAYGAARAIVAADASTNVVARVRELQIADDATDDPASAARDADLVILCVPVGVCGDVARRIAPHLREGAILSDVGSVKAAVVAQVAPHVPAGAHFIPAHPIAGTEYS